MRNFLFAATTLLLLASCSSEPDSYTVKGTLRGDLKENTQVFLKKIDDNNQPVEIDTTTLVGGTFEFTGVSNIPELHYIFVDNTPGYTAVILENGVINFNAQRDSLGFAKVDGTFQNKVFFDYLDTSRELSEKARSIQNDLRQSVGSGDQDTNGKALRDEMEELQAEYKKFEAEYIENNPNALIAALLLDRAIVTKAIENSKIEDLYQNLSDAIKNTSSGKKVLKSLEKAKEENKKAKSTEIGSKAPLFSGPNPSGEIINLKDKMGKVTLVDFWAAWCRPCRAENANVVAVYNKYHDKGLNIVGVSLDRTADAWKKAIEADGLTWNHISNIAYFDDEIAKLYSIRSIPAAFLLDENGIIVAKNLRGAALEEKVAEMLN